LIIRPAGRDDLAALSALARQTYADAFGHSFRAPDLAAHLQSGLPTIIPAKPSRKTSSCSPKPKAA